MKHHPPRAQHDNSAFQPCASGGTPIVVHSHLRWDFVWQRPQQTMARLAECHRVAFIEEPIADGGEARVLVTQPQPNIVRIVPVVAASRGAGTDAQCAEFMPHLERAFREHPLLRGRFERPIQWFYSPMVAPCFLDRFDAAAVVYDCMDELANFHHAPRDLPQREATLLSAADLVFTGGYRLYTRKAEHHHNVHFYGCGVDVGHYGKARDPGTAVPADVANLPAPVLGYFGVIDERLDYALIDALAAAFPSGSIVMIGPVVKVDRAKLPRRPNLHWLGQRGYEDLPAYVKAFDVCLMPFAMNAATENINPTKTLEYMAAGKPVISTAVPDVVRHFTPIVQVAHDHDEFLELTAIAAAGADLDLIERGIARAEGQTWDAIVGAMHAHLLAAVEPQRAELEGG